MIKHPKNKAERRLIEAKKKKKRNKTMRTVEVSPDNINSAVESFLFSMRMIDADDKVVGVNAADADFSNFFVLIEKQEQEGSVN